MTYIIHQNKTPEKKDMLFTGDRNDRCPITFIPFTDLECPVVFKNDPVHPYEASALAHWLSIRQIIPHSNTECDWEKSPLEIISPVWTDTSISLSNQYETHFRLLNVSVFF
jgi:hypothetical protein